MRINRRIRNLDTRPRLTQAQQFELLLGQYSARSAFPNEDARRQAWIAHRDELTAIVEYAWGRIRYDLGGFLPGEGCRISKARARLKGSINRE